MGKLVQGVDVQSEIVIHRPVAEVAPYVCDPENAPEWYENIKAAHWASKPGICVGARASFVASFLGKKLVYTYELMDYKDGARLIMSTAEGPFPMTTEYHFAPHGPGGAHTHMILRNQGQPIGFSKWVAPMMATAMRKANQKDLARLKQILESTSKA